MVHQPITVYLQIAYLFTSVTASGLDVLNLFRILPRQTSGSHTAGPTPAGPTQPGSAQNCNKWYTVVSGDSCYGVEQAFGITSAQFLAWNPAVSTDCLTNFWVGESYCVGVGTGPASTTSSSSTSSIQSTSSSTSSSLVSTTSATANLTYSFNNPITSWNITRTTVDRTFPPSHTQAGQNSECNDWALVRAGDSCDSLPAKYSIEKSDFMSWNPAINSDCSTLYIGWWVCVAIRPTSVGTIYIPSNSTPVTIPPYTPYTPTTLPPINSSFVPLPTQTGIISDCKAWYKAMANDTCSGLALKGYFTVDQFVEWNPGVKADCSGFWAGYYYCVASSSTVPRPPTVTQWSQPVQWGISSNCTLWYQMTGSDTCDSIVQMFGTFSNSDFLAWNPAVNSDCSGLTQSDWYCVAQPGTPTTRTAPASTPNFVTGTGYEPQQTGTVSNCARYWLVGKFDTCASIEKTNGIPEANFLAWNPAIGTTSCSNLISDYYVCVAVSSSTGTSSVTSSSSTQPTGTLSSTSTSSSQGGGPTATPSPTQAGMVSGCHRFYYVESGDGCWAISNAANIALSDFYAWNPAVKSDCSALLAGYYVCIGIIGPTTTISTGAPVPT